MNLVIPTSKMSTGFQLRGRVLAKYVLDPRFHSQHFEGRGDNLTLCQKSTLTGYGGTRDNLRTQKADVEAGELHV